MESGDDFDFVLGSLWSIIVEFFKMACSVGVEMGKMIVSSLSKGFSAGKKGLL